MSTCTRHRDRLQQYISGTAVLHYFWTVPVHRIPVTDLTLRVINGEGEIREAGEIHLKLGCARIVRVVWSGGVLPNFSKLYEFFGGR